MLSDEWLPRYRLLENFTAKWNGNGNAYDRGDYNSSFALRAVELKMDGRQWDLNPQEEKYVLLEIERCCSLGHFSDIFNGIQNIFILFNASNNKDQITVYQSLFINKANVNRGSRKGMTCSRFISVISLSEISSLLLSHLL